MRNSSKIRMREVRTSIKLVLRCVRVHFIDFCAACYKSTHTICYRVSIGLPSSFRYFSSNVSICIDDCSCIILRIDWATKFSEKWTVAVAIPYCSVLLFAYLFYLC